MPLTWQQSVIMILVIALTTFLTRALPFILFPANKRTPEYINYLGKVLPFAIIGMLIVYCLKNTSAAAYPYGLPEIISVGAVAVIHLWKRNSLLSIGSGTLIYMLLVQLVFK